MGKALQAYRRHRDPAGRGESGPPGEVLDENWIENSLGLTGWTPGLDIALAKPETSIEAASMSTSPNSAIGRSVGGSVL